MVREQHEPVCCRLNVLSTVHTEGPLSPLTQAHNHDPGQTWDPVIDWQMMSRNVKGFMSLFHSDKPVVVKVHGFCVAGGTDMALCADFLVIEDTARIGYPPARVWGTPTTAMWVARLGVEKAKRMLLTGDLITGRQAHDWCVTYFYQSLFVFTWFTGDWRSSAPQRTSWTRPLTPCCSVSRSCPSTSW